MASKAIKKHEAAVQSLEDLATHPEYQAGFFSGGSVEASFKVTHASCVKRQFSDSVYILSSSANAHLFSLLSLCGMLEKGPWCLYGNIFEVRVRKSLLFVLCVIKIAHSFHRTAKTN